MSSVPEVLAMVGDIEAIGASVAVTAKALADGRYPSDQPTLEALAALGAKVSANAFRVGLELAAAA